MGSRSCRLRQAENFSRYDPNRPGTCAGWSQGPGTCGRRFGPRVGYTGRRSCTSGEVTGPFLSTFDPPGPIKVTWAGGGGSADSNRKNPENGEVWVRWGKFSTCYRLGVRSPVQKVETREQPDLQGPKSYMGGRVGAALIPTVKMTK